MSDYLIEVTVKAPAPVAFTVGPQGPSGPPGIQGEVGPSGPSSVSSDAGNLATLGSDDLILVAASQVAPVVGALLTHHDPAWMEVTAAGVSEVVGTYAYDTESNGKPSYLSATGSIAWADSQWAINLNGTAAYASSEDVATPDLVVTWTAGMAPTANLYVSSGLNIEGMDGEYLPEGDSFYSAVSGFYVTGEPDFGISSLRSGDGSRHFAVGTGGEPLTAADWESLCLTLTVGELTAPLFAISLAGMDDPTGKFEGTDGSTGWRVEYGEYAENDLRWLIQQDFVLVYTSAEDVASPQLCQTWVAETGTPPLPVITVADTITISNLQTAPEPLPTVVALENWPDQTPLAADGAGGVTPLTPATPSYSPFTFTATTDWVSALVAAQDLVAALGLSLEPADGEQPGHAVIITFEAGTTPRWGAVRCYAAFSLVAEWQYPPYGPVVAGDLVRVHGVVCGA